jgi:hypothetical protein
MSRSRTWSMRRRAEGGVWNGLDRFGQKVASGMYLLELVVNGERAPPLKIVVAN